MRFWERTIEEIISVPRILQSREFISGGSIIFSKGGRAVRTKSLEAEAKCAISVRFFTFSCGKFRI